MSTRASILLENDKETFIPYNFMQEEYFLCEGIDPEKAKHDLELIYSKAKPAYQSMKKGILGERDKYIAMFTGMTEQYPEIHSKLMQDINAVEQKTSVILRKTGSALRSKDSPEKLQENVGDLFQTIYEGRLNLFSLQALRNLELPEGFFRRLRDIIIAILGFIVIGTINGLFIASLSPIFGIEAAMTIGVLICAPIIEELYKVITVRILKSPMPSFVTFLFEFLHYSAKIIGIATAMSSGGLIFLLVGLLGRVFALEMHMTTTKAYMDDVSLLGKVRLKTYFSGVVLHMIWNSVAIITHALTALFSILKFIGIFIQVSLTQNLSRIFLKMFRG